MRLTVSTRWAMLAAAALLAVCLVGTMQGQGTDAARGAPAPAAAPASNQPAATVQTRGFGDFLTAGGVVGYVIMALSVLSAGLVIDSLIHVRSVKLLPPTLIEQCLSIARKGKFSDILLVAQNDTMLGRIIRAGFSQGQFGLPAVRQAMQEQGVREVTRLNQRVGYLGFIGSVGPMLGLLGTVVGMIGSFNVLGSAKGSARPDELATGISLALVTTCEGLVLAIPMMFFHNHFRDRVLRLGQESSGVCERLLMVVGGIVESRARAASSAPLPQAIVQEAAPVQSRPQAEG